MCEKSKKSSPVFWCKACGASMTPRKRKPVSTWSGEMNSVYSDLIPEFPRDEWEDMCHKCISEIRNYNADLTESMENIIGSNNPVFINSPVRIDHSQDKMEEECSELRMDIEFRYTQHGYEGSIKD